jgi:hypothetical protein
MTLNKKEFSIHQWLNLDPQKSGQSQTANAGPINHEFQNVKTINLPTFYGKNNQKNQDHYEQVGINKFFTPGWQGGALKSKASNQLEKLIDTIHIDVIRQWNSVNAFPRITTGLIFENFTNFLNFMNLECKEIIDSKTFWKHLKDENSKYEDILSQYKKVYTLRVAIIYLLKVRFIHALAKQGSVIPKAKDFIYPNAFFTNTFKKGSKFELNSKALESNSFSWYKPAEMIGGLLEKNANLFDELSITEITKSISQKIEYITGKNFAYSHALSQNNFGFFLNSVLINLPIWLSAVEKTNHCSYKVNVDELEIISTKFCGDYLESLSQSHWLAQDNNKYIKWEQILCPDFKSNDFETGYFLKICNELQFLTFLTNIATSQGHDPLKYICEVTKGHLFNRKSTSDPQKNLISEDLSLNESTYDRIVLNICPNNKNNSYHSLINSIEQQQHCLKKHGYLYILTSTKLFIPSQKQKTDFLLKDLKLDTVINLEQIEGKGEAPNYIYVFSKKTDKMINTRESLHHFRLTGVLNAFHEISHLTTGLQNFFMQYFGETPAIYQKELSANFKLEFYQDAILDGTLVYASNKDSSKITHPNFFKSLTNTCLPLSHFFNVNNINFNHENDIIDDNSFLANDDEQDKSYSHIIIVDKKEKDQIKLEIISSELLSVKVQQYGHYGYSYFGVRKKWENLNINAVREYFKTPIGIQIIDLAFNSRATKTKASLSKVLIPKGFVINSEIPNHIHKIFELLNFNKEQILEMAPTKFAQDFNRILPFVTEYKRQYPAQILAMVSNLKLTLSQILFDISVGKDRSIINFKNQIIKTPLLLAKKMPIYPNNQDIYLEFNSESDIDLLDANLTQIRLKTANDKNEKSYYLEIYGQNDLLLKIYSHENMIQFLAFILQQAINFPLGRVIQGIQVPALDDLNAIVASVKNSEASYQQIFNKINQEYLEILNSIITTTN